MSKLLEEMSPEKRIILAATLCILVSFLFSKFLAPPPPQKPRNETRSVSGGDDGTTPTLEAPESEPVEAAGEQRIRPPEESLAASPQTSVSGATGSHAIGSLAQSNPPEIHDVTIDTPEARIVLSTQGGCFRSFRLKNYWEIDPPIELLEAQVKSAVSTKEREFWSFRLDEARERKRRLEGKEYRKGEPVPEEAWVEMIPPYPDAAAYPLVLRFENGGSDAGLVYECEVEQARVTEGTETVFSLKAKTDSGLVITKTLRFGGETSAFEVEIGMDSPQGIDGVRQAVGKSWSLEWPDGIGHLPFHFHGSQEENSLYSLRNDSKENSPTLRNWLLKQAQKTNLPVIPDDYRYPLEGRVGWIVVQTRYFIASFLPSQNPPMQGVYIANNILDRPQFDTRVGMGVISQVTEKPRVVKMYVGPKITSVLREVGGAMGLERVVYDSWFGAVCLLVEWLLGFFYSIIPSYGLAIILLCILSKIVLYPLTYKQAQTQKKMAVLQPKIAELKEKYKNDSQKLSQEQMKLWKKHGVNPMGGCLPMLAQIPIFIALYRTIQSSIDLRGASFLWIHDLSLPDMTFFLPVSLPYLGNAINVLPFVMMVISLIQMHQQKKMMPDPSQAQMMMYMSFFFVFILYHFSSGLVLYWTANSLTQWIQQIVMEHLGHAAPKSVTADAGGSSDDKKKPTGAGRPDRTAGKKPPAVRRARPRRRKAAR